MFQMLISKHLNVAITERKDDLQEGVEKAHSGQQAIIKEGKALAEGTTMVLEEEISLNLVHGEDLMDKAIEMIVIVIEMIVDSLVYNMDLL